MSSYWTEVLADSPVFLLKMEEASGNLSDYVGAKSGVQSGSPTYQVTGPGAGAPTAITFPTGAYFSFTDHADLDLADGPFSIEFFFKRHDAAVSGDILGKGSTADATGYNVTVTSTDRIRLRQGNDTQHIQSTAAVMDDTNWHHCVVNRGTSTSGLVYIDGSEATTSVTSALTFSDNAIALTVGRRAAANGSFLGTIAAVAIYKSQLSAGRVSAHYAAKDTADTPPAGTDFTSTPNLRALSALRNMGR